MVNSPAGKDSHTLKWFDEAVFHHDWCLCQGLSLQNTTKSIFQICFNETKCMAPDPQSCKTPVKFWHVKWCRLERFKVNFPHAIHSSAPGVGQWYQPRPPVAHRDAAETTKVSWITLSRLLPFAACLQVFSWLCLLEFPWSFTNTTWKYSMQPVPWSCSEGLQLWPTLPWSMHLLRHIWLGFVEHWQLQVE